LKAKRNCDRRKKHFRGSTKGGGDLIFACRREAGEFWLGDEETLPWKKTWSYRYGEGEGSKALKEEKVKRLLLPPGEREEGEGTIFNQEKSEKRRSRKLISLKKDESLIWGGGGGF